MLVKVEKQQLCMNQLIAKKSDIAKVEGDIIVNDVKPDVLGIVNSNGIVCVNKKEVQKGKLKIDGTINTYIMYLADGEKNSIRCLNSNIDFTHIIDIDNYDDSFKTCVKVELKNIEAKIVNERKISVTAILEIVTTIYKNETKAIISKIDEEEIQILNDNVNITSLIGEGNNIIYGRDTILLNEEDDLAEIMKVEFAILNKESKPSYNKIVTKADAEVKIMYLTEDNRVNSVTANIPVMGFVDMENIKEDSFCDTRYQLKNLMLKVNSEENRNSIYVEVEVELDCSVYEEKEINLIKDVYGIDNEFKCRQEEIMAMTNKKYFTEVYRINEEILAPEVGNNKIYDITVCPYISKTSVQGDTISFTGELGLKIIYQTNEDIAIKEIKIPITFQMTAEGISNGTEYITEIEIKKDNFITGQNGKLVADIELLFTIVITDYKKLNIINEIEKTECDETEKYSMVIYFVKPGDTLWKIAKKFKTSVEDIARINNIENENKLNIGEQLYIPKYVKKSVAV